jgi:GDP-4-dehydro-6-deoxy-D-mannose reductase
LSLGQSGRAYNVCVGSATMMGDLLDTLRAQCAIALELQPAEERLRPNDIASIVGDRTRIESELGWTPKIPMSQTLSDILDYWRGQVRVGA